MRVFHWNMAPPSSVAHKSTPEMACGFRLRRGRGLHGAATNSLTICSELRARKSGEIEMPLVYPERHFVAGGGLISYGPDFLDQYRARPATPIAFSRARDRPDPPLQAASGRDKQISRPLSRKSVWGLGCWGAGQAIRSGEVWARCP
jgi:hypothetical protein